MGEVLDRGFDRWQARGLLEERLEILVRGLTYQDGWTFLLIRSAVNGSPNLNVTWEVDDVDAPGQRTLITGTITFRPDYGDQAFRAFLFDVYETISRFEAHERLERLRIDGCTIWDPHPPGSRGQGLVCAPDLSAPLPLLLEGVPA